MRQRLEQLLQLGVPVVRHPALAPEEVVVAGDELVEGHPAARLGPEQVHQLAGEEGELARQGGAEAWQATRGAAVRT